MGHAKLHPQEAVVRVRVQRCVDADAQQGRRAVAFAPDVVESALHGTRACDAVGDTRVERMQMAKGIGETLLQQAADGRHGCCSWARRGSGCVRKPDERCQGLVEVSHHDHLLRVKAPAQQLAVQSVGQLVLRRVGQAVVEAAGHVDGDQQRALAGASCASMWRPLDERL